MSQFTTKAQNVLHLNVYKHGRPFKGPGTVPNGVTGTKYALEKTSFSIRAEYTRIFKCPHRLKPEGLRPSERGGCTWETYIDMN